MQGLATLVCILENPSSSFDPSILFPSLQEVPKNAGSWGWSVVLRSTYFYSVQGQQIVLNDGRTRVRGVYECICHRRHSILGFLVPDDISRAGEYDNQNDASIRKHYASLAYGSGI